MTLEPDLMWWDGTRCLFVGDAKYKNLTGRSVPNTDLYQVLSYATALDLPSALLVYAKGELGEEGKATFTVQNGRRRLEIASLNISGSLKEILV